MERFRVRPGFLSRRLDTSISLDKGVHFLGEVQSEHSNDVLVASISDTPHDPEWKPYDQCNDTCHKESSYRRDLPKWIQISQFDITRELHPDYHCTRRQEGRQEVSFNKHMAPSRDKDPKHKQ
jgi:hypothetical protein